MGYALPSPTSYVSCSWQCHRDRRPPSTEAGTDYASAYNSPCYAVEAGVVTSVKRTTAGAMGRYAQYLLDDGRETRSLHMARVDVHVGQRVARGQVIGLTGASGHGSEWGYGSHVHQTLWPGRAWANPTIDFARYVGSAPVPPQPPVPTPPTEEVLEMSTEVIVTFKDNNNQPLPDSKRRVAFVNTESGFWCDFSWLTLAEADNWAKQVGMPSALRFSDAGFDKFTSRLALVRPAEA